MLVFKKINNLYTALNKMKLAQEANNLLKLAEVTGIYNKEIFPGKVINLGFNDELRIRSEPNVESFILEDLSNNDSFDFLGEKKNNFLKIRAKGTEGWIHSDYAEYYDFNGNVIFRGKKSLESEIGPTPDTITTETPENKEVNKSPTSVGTGEFSSPVDGNPLITSKFGWRIHPILKKRKHHNGADIRARQGVPLFAIEDGIIEKASDMGTAGNTVVLKGSNGREWSYMHLSSFSVKSGDVVSSGQEVGKSGSTGRSTAAHLHLQLKVNGSVKDPLPTFDELGISYSFKHKK